MDVEYLISASHSSFSKLSLSVQVLATAKEWAKIRLPLSCKIWTDASKYISTCPQHLTFSSEKLVSKSHATDGLVTSLGFLRWTLLRDGWSQPGHLAKPSLLDFKIFYFKVQIQTCSALILWRTTIENHSSFSQSQSQSLLPDPLATDSLEPPMGLVPPMLVLPEYWHTQAVSLRLNWISFLLHTKIIWSMGNEPFPTEISSSWQWTWHHLNWE